MRCVHHSVGQVREFAYTQASSQVIKYLSVVHFSFLLDAIFPRFVFFFFTLPKVACSLSSCVKHLIRFKLGLEKNLSLINQSTLCTYWSLVQIKPICWKCEFAYTSGWKCWVCFNIQVGVHWACIQPRSCWTCLDWWGFGVKCLVKTH